MCVSAGLPQNACMCNGRFAAGPLFVALFLVKAVARQEKMRYNGTVRRRRLKKENGEGNV